MAKLLSLPLYGVGRLATMLIPRTRDEWVFGCGAGIGDGALELYEYARAGITLEREARAVTIYRLELAYSADEQSFVAIKMIVQCSKGTYVRTLASDLGAMLGCGAHLTALRRTRIGALL